MKSLLAISRWRHVLRADSVPQALARGCAASMDKAQDAVCLSKLYFSLSKKVSQSSLLQSNSFSCAEGGIQRGTQMNLCLGSCHSFLARPQTVQCCNLFYFLKNIFLCKESRSGLTKRNSITDKIGMTANPSTPTEVFCPLIAIVR